jgi:signal transduction histidine kinase
MFPDDRLGRRIIGSLMFGVFVGLVNFAIDVSFPRFHVVPTTTILNDLIIGAAAGLLAYVWVSRQTAKHVLEMSREKLTREAIEKERKRMALDLHDTVCQAHTAAIMYLECAQDSLDSNVEPGKHVERALHLVRGATTEMRCALWDLYPEEMKRVDLKTALESLSKSLTAGSGLNVQLLLDGASQPLPQEIEKGLLRISQEALSNIVKHAQAHDVRIELLLESHQARLYVIDDGRGFRGEPSSGTFGLTSMRDRAEALGGVWEIRSEPGHGTEVRARIPVPSTQIKR